MVRAGHAAQVAWDALGGEARAKLLERAADLLRSACATSSSRSARAKPERHWSTRFSRCARRSISCAFTPPKRAVSSRKPLPLPGRPASRTSCACTAAGCSPAFQPWNFPLAIFTGLVSAPLAAGNAVIAKPAEQTPLIGALAVELMHEAGIPKDIVQLAPGHGQGCRRNADCASVAFGRRLHRLDRDRARDQPHAGRARRADRPVRRRDRRAECDDRRQLGAARAGHARRDVFGIPERRPALLRAARPVRPGRRRRRHDRDDRRRDGGADDRRPARPRHRRRPGDRRRGCKESARRPSRVARARCREGLAGEAAAGASTAASSLPPIYEIGSR